MKYTIFSVPWKFWIRLALFDKYAKHEPNKTPSVRGRHTYHTSCNHEKSENISLPGEAPLFDLLRNMYIPPRRVRSQTPCFTQSIYMKSEYEYL